MNYLSHFYFDQKAIDSYFVVGLALPDLMKMADKRWNIHPHKIKEKLILDPFFSSLNRGWEKHIAVDYYFHNSPYFIEHNRLLKEEIHRHEVLTKKIRPFVMGHVGLEIVLDSVLLRDDVVDINEYYKHLNKVDVQVLIDFLSLNGIADAHRFKATYERFLEAKYLFHYSNNENLSYAFKRMSERIFNIEITREEQRAYEHCVDWFYPIIQQNYLEVFDHIQTHLSA